MFGLLKKLTSTFQWWFRQSWLIFLHRWISIFPIQLDVIITRSNIIHYCIPQCLRWNTYQNMSTQNTPYNSAIWTSYGVSIVVLLFNSLRPSDAIWRHRSGSTLAQVMACCLTAPSHYLNQCWLIISKVLWHSSEGNFIRDTSATIH